jgi:hypothetical protein
MREKKKSKRENFRNSRCVNKKPEKKVKIIESNNFKKKKMK